MQTTKKKLSELHKTEKNIRRHSEKQIQEYVRSLKMFGQIRPFVVTEDGEILVGNGMYEAMMNMGAEDCDVYVMSGLSENDKKKLMLADNKVYELGFTNVGMLDDILSELNGDFDIPGYDPSLLETIMSSPSEIVEQVAAYGQYDEAPREEHKVEISSFHEQPVSTYAPPVQAEDGAFVSPEKEKPANFIVCPYCGEKIWL